ncbi:MAG: glycosyltransferase family 2 protein, partial [bacterium]|nr:glycosyltransferase family 2 protein [bacterium]
MPNKKPSVTVIVLHYQEYKLTKECVDSVLKSIYSNFDILIIDNGSTNNSFDKLSKTYFKNTNVTIKRSPNNLQFAGGFNYGATFAKGKYIILLSNDIVVDPHWIDELIKHAHKKTLIQPRIMRYYDKERVDNVGGSYNIWGIGRGMNNWNNKDQTLVQEVDFASATTLMASRSFFMELEGYDSWYRSHYEDVDLSLRTQKNGGICLVSYNSIIYHKGSETYKKHASQKTTLIDVRKNRIQTIMKNYRGIEKFLRLTLCILTLFPFVIQDLLRINEDMFLTWRAIVLGLTRST